MISQNSQVNGQPREKLQADVKILIELQQIEPRRRTFRHVNGEFLGLKHARSLARFPGSDKILDDLFRLAENLEICRAIEVRARRHIGSADHHRLAVCLTELDQFEAIGLLVEHPTGHDQVGPDDFGRVQFLGVAIDETELPVLRQHGRDRDQAERRGGIAGADKLAGLRVVPE